MEALQGLETEERRLHGVHVAAVGRAASLPSVVVDGSLQLRRAGQLRLFTLVWVQVFCVPGGIKNVI